MTGLPDQCDLGEQLGDLFESTAGGADVPPLPLHEVLARGEALTSARRRRAAVWTAVAAAVAVVAVVLPVAIARHGSSDEPAPVHHTNTSAPKGRPTTLPYLDGHRLHVGEGTVDTDADAILSSGGTVYVHGRGDAGLWQHLTARGLKQVDQTVPTREEPWRGWHGQVLSPDGRLLVVVTFPTQDSTRITALDTEDDTELDRVDLDLPFSNWTGGGIDVSLLGVDGQGRAYWTQPDDPYDGGRTVWAWRPGHGEPEQLGEPFSSAPYEGIVVTPVGPVVGASLLRQAKDGSWEEDGDVPSARGARWSPSGNYLTRGGARPAVLTRADGDSTAVSLPGPLVRWIGFEDDARVLAAVGTDGNAQLARCVVADGSCEVVQDLPSGWRSWQWATNGLPAPVSSPVPDAAGTGVRERREPYVEGTTLHADGETFEVGKRINLVSAGDTVLVGHWGDPITWRILRDGRLVSLPYGTGRVPVLSPRGTRVAVSTNPTPQTSRITVYDTVTDARIAYVDLDLPATCCDGGSVQQLSIDSAGTVHWVEERSNGRAPEMRWRPGNAPVEVRQDIRP